MDNIVEIDTAEMLTEPHHFEAPFVSLNAKRELLFVYGILKRGFELDLSNYGGEFLGEAKLHGANIYSIGDGVGLRLSENSKDIVHGEVFEIPNNLWKWLDAIENHPYTYKREIVKVIRRIDNGISVMRAWVYIHQYSFENYKNSKKFENGRYPLANF